MRLSFSIACAHKSCQSKLKLDTVVTPNSEWTIDSLAVELGWRRRPGTKDFDCPEHLEPAA